MKKFHEYLSAKGNGKPGAGQVKGTVATDVVADELEVEPGSKGMLMPPKEKYGLKGGKQQPYTPDGKKVVSGGKGGFGDQGSEKPYDVARKTKPATLPTAEFAYHELMPKIREAIKSYPAITENLVRELQRDNLLGVLVGEMLAHNETYKHIAEVMASRNHGYSVCRKLARAMREGVAAPFHQAMDHGDEMDPNGGVDPNLGLTGDDAMEERPTMDFGGGGDEEDEFGDDLGGDGLGGDEFGDDEFGDDELGGGAMSPEEEIAQLKARIKELEAGAAPGAEGGDEFGTEDPYADEEDPFAPPPEDPNAGPVPPDPNQPPLPPKPGSPPAMENMRRAMRTVFENYKPLRESVQPKKTRKRSAK